MAAREIILGSGGGGTIADGAITLPKLADGLKTQIGHQVIDLSYHDFAGNSVADNTTFLINMRTALAGLNKPQYDIIFPYVAGGIDYSDNRWLYNIQKFHIQGNGTRFRSTRGGSWGTEWQPFQAGDMFTDAVLTSYNPSGNYATGHKFNTVIAGSSTLTLTTTAEHSNYAVGNRVFICGFDKTLTGYPPNPTYFEWAKIEAINTTTGVITLNKVIKHGYNSAWLDSTNSLDTGFGKPRIFNLDRTGYSYPKYAKFSDCVFANGTKNTGSSVDETGIFQFPAEELVLDRCTTEYAFWPAQNQKFIESFCKSEGDSEFDKIVDYAEISDCTFNGFLANATSFNTLVLKRNTFADYVFVSPLFLYAEGNHFHTTQNTGSSLQQGFGGEYTQKVYIKDNTFSIQDQGIKGGHIELSRTFSVTVAGASGNDMLVTASGNNQIAYTLRKGVPMWKSDGSKRGVVTDVTHNGTQWVISGTWAAPVAAETWVFSSLGELIDEGGNMVLNGKSPMFHGSTLKFQGNKGQIGGIRETIIREDTLNIVDNGGTFAMELYGTLVDVSVNVIKPYTGTNDNAHLFIRTNGAVDNLEINLMVKGRRVLTSSGVTGAQTGDGTPSTTNIGSFVTLLGVNNLQYTSFQKIAVDSPDDLPILEIIVHWYPY